MTKFIIGRKSGMTQLFDENGNVIPATVIECEPMYVLQNKTVETDGYKACKVGTGSVRAKLVNKPDAGQFKKADVEVKRIIREFEPDQDYSLGQEIKVSDMFAVTSSVTVRRVVLQATAPCITEESVPWALHPHRAALYPARRCLDIWAQLTAQSRTSAL